MISRIWDFKLEGFYITRFSCTCYSSVVPKITTNKNSPIHHATFLNTFQDALDHPNIISLMLFCPCVINEVRSPFPKRGRQMKQLMRPVEEIILIAYHLRLGKQSWERVAFRFYVNFRDWIPKSLIYEDSFVSLFPERFSSLELGEKNRMQTCARFGSGSNLWSSYPFGLFLPIGRSLLIRCGL